jgi:hypothetical protein
MRPSLPVSQWQKLDQGQSSGFPNQATLHRVAVHVPKLLNKSVMRENLEVIVTGLPELFSDAPAFL